MLKTEKGKVYQGTLKALPEQLRITETASKDHKAVWIAIAILGGLAMAARFLLLY